MISPVFVCDRFPCTVRRREPFDLIFFWLCTSPFIFAVRLPPARRFPKASAADVLSRLPPTVRVISFPLDRFPISGIEPARIERFFPLCTVVLSMPRCPFAATEISPFPAMVLFSARIRSAVMEMPFPLRMFAFVWMISFASIVSVPFAFALPEGEMPLPNVPLPRMRSARNAALLLLIILPSLLSSAADRVISLP